jgi:succinate-semialdehyde dehydrogenase/glutarate-semialdehyde dehydrogenase
MTQPAAVGSASEERVLAGVPKELLIGGEWRPASGGGRFAVEDPATGEALCAVADATAQDATAALSAASDAQATWAAHPPRERGEILRRAFELIASRIDDLALLMTLEMGKSLAESRTEIAYANEFLRWFSEQAVRIEGGYAVSPNGANRLITMRQPVGPCLLITPWNFPLAMATRKVGPALAAGCTVVAKPAMQTPLSMLAFAQIIGEAGLPPGVMNVITTSHAGPVLDPLFDDERLRKLSFTGSTEVGRRLAARAMGRVLRVSMELGGNAPFIVFADADLDAAIEGAMLAKLRNIGEACTSANRLYVARPLAQEFAAGLARRMEKLRLGRGTEPGTDLGPLIDEAQRTKVHELVEDAVARGAQVLTGGRPPEGPGYFYPATVLGEVAPGSRLLAEEIFGPVAPVVAFDSDEEALVAANATEFGLVAYVYTRELDRALRTAEALETGMIGLNQGIVSNPAAPFGGVKQSGFGREGGHEGIHEYLAVKYVALSL